MQDGSPVQFRKSFCKITIYAPTKVLPYNTDSVTGQAVSAISARARHMMRIQLPLGVAVDSAVRQRILQLVNLYLGEVWVKQET